MKREICYPLLLIACGALVYSNALSGPFIYDDEAFIEFNEDIRQLWPPEWGWPATGRYLPLHSRPITGFTLALNYAFGGLQVEGYHLFNIALHLLCGLAFYGVVGRATDRYVSQRSGCTSHNRATAVAVP